MSKIMLFVLAHTKTIVMRKIRSIEITNVRETSFFLTVATKKAILRINRNKEGRRCLLVAI